VANQYSVLDSSATSFAHYFYGSLALGHTLGHAAREARIAVNYSLQGELIDWAVPVLYARDANRALCGRAPVETTAPLTMAPTRRRRAAGSRFRRIAVWDVDMVFPRLDHTLDRMNEAQSVYGFELVDMSAPLDAWEFSEQGDFLRADRMAARLQSKTVELRVDLLGCVTRHPIRDEESPNLYGWWPANRKPAVGIFSTSGFDIATEGPETDRAIANATVSLLAGFFGELESHEGGAKTCPLFFNKKRDLARVTGPQKLDARCSKALAQKLKREELEALDALLTVFR
jgi:hypothetical protein